MALRIPPVTGVGSADVGVVAAGVVGYGEVPVQGAGAGSKGSTVTT